MNTTPNNGGAAFPHAVQHLHSSYAAAVPGMSLRDWFAGQTLAGLMGTANLTNVAASAETFAKAAFAVADAMLLNRSTTP